MLGLLLCREAMAGPGCVGCVGCDRGARGEGEQGMM